MALANCTPTTFTPNGPWRFYEALPIHYVGSHGQGQSGTAQVLCVYRRPILITWTCCTPPVTTYTGGFRYTTVDAGPTSTLPVLSANVPIPGNVGSALGASINLVNWWVDPKAARGICGNAPANPTTTKDLYGMVKADCSPSWWRSPYILYPWGARRKLTRTSGGWKVGPFVSAGCLSGCLTLPLQMALGPFRTNPDPWPVLTYLLTDGRVPYIPPAPEVRIVEHGEREMETEGPESDS